MMLIKDGHPLALEIEGIQDIIIYEDDETEVKNKAHCVIKMKAQRGLKLIRLAESTVDEVGSYINNCTAFM